MWGRSARRRMGLTLAALVLAAGCNKTAEKPAEPPPPPEPEVAKAPDAQVTSLSEMAVEYEKLEQQQAATNQQMSALIAKYQQRGGSLPPGFGAELTDEQRTLLAERIKTARKTIDVVGVVNELVTSDLPDDDFLWPFLNEGGMMRVLFINPNGEAVHRREELERIHQDRIIPRGDFERRTRSAINCLERYKDASLGVWVYERQPSVAMMIANILTMDAESGYLMSSAIGSANTNISDEQTMLTTITALRMRS